MQQENNIDFITMLIKMFQLESCFRTNYEPFYGSEIDLSLDTFYNDQHRLGRQRTQYMK